MSRCYLCKHKTLSGAFTKHGWTTLRCRNCGLLSLEFRGSYAKFIREYYDRRFFTGSDKRAGYCNYEGDRYTEGKNMDMYLSGIKKFKSSGNLLDVGCATGLFMLKAKAEGFNVYGVDVSDYAVEIAQKRFGTRVKRSSIENANFPKGKFDVVTLFDVIEHLKDPREVLGKLRTFLKDDGILVINTGDSGSFIAKFQGENWHYFIPPQHFFYFSQKTLRRLLQQTGFSAKKIEHKGKWLTLRYLFHLARQIQNDVLGHLGFALVGRNILGRIPVHLNLFDNITVYATKDPNGNKASSK